MVVVRGPGHLPGHLISQVLHSQIASTLRDESLARQVRLETVTAWVNPEAFVNDMQERARNEGRARVRFLVDELWLAEPSTKLLALVRQVLELLETTKKKIVGSDFGNVTGSGGAPSGAGSMTLRSSTSEATSLNTTTSSSAKPRSATSRSAEPREAARADTRLKTLEALNEVKENLEKLNTVRDVAKKSLTTEVGEELEKLSFAVEEIREVLSARGEYNNRMFVFVVVVIVAAVAVVVYFDLKWVGLFFQYIVFFWVLMTNKLNSNKCQRFRI